MKIKKKKYDLRSLEDVVRATYASFQAKETERTRTDLFLSIKELAYAMLDVSKEYSKLKDISVIAYEYALYLLERIMTKSFQPQGIYNENFPWVAYLRKNLRHVAFNVRDDFFWRDKIKDLEILIDDEAFFSDLEPTDVYADNNDLFEQIQRNEIAGKLERSLHMFYTAEEIQRLLSFCRDALINRGMHLDHKDLPEDCRQFSGILLASIKRLAQPELRSFKAKTNKKLLDSALRSSIFLSTIANTEIFDQELFLSLDIDSLFRLVHVYGGRTVRIPSEKELNNLLGAVVAVSKIITEGQKVKDSIKNVRADYDLALSPSASLSKFIENLVASFEIQGEDDKSEPILNSLISSLADINKILKKYDEAKGDDHCYNTKLTSTLTCLKNTISSIERRYDAKV